MKLLSLLCVGVFLTFLCACEKAETSVKTDAQLLVELPLEAWQADELITPKSATVGSLYRFNGSTSFSLASKDNLNNCPGAVLGVAAGSGSQLIFNGLEGADEIQSLTVVWGYAHVGTIDCHMQEPVELLAEGEQLTASEFSLNLDEFLQPVIQMMDNNPRTLIFIRVYGYSNFEISVHADLKVPIMVESDIASPRFTL
ncbi:hypothetical protein [Maribellus sp. YY47]|uniref:hypothetical protein n=1 Tax=Maribellus sp. YY47 TaxID=2929486 RepID=UPI0020015553|nr:hypothetical protein [Maribellus sp. YY47]MCK3685911.1 hypothetical protein [Maribellus sp. YY47]